MFYSQGDEPSGGGDGGIVNQKNLRHFDHTFKGELHTTSGDYLVSVFGECKFAKREISLNCKGTSLEIVEEIGLKSKKTLDIMYQHVRITLLNLLSVNYNFFNTTLYT
jgi:hypothetical protein